jgi:quinoprotein glucose dehydrogenase
MAPFPFWFIQGSPNLGGPVATASGLTFIGATADHFLRAFETETGVELWKGRLPTSGHGLPITYQLQEDSAQYVVIAAGGHAVLGTPPGDHLIAFKLPDKK